mmetsp:Transcript_10214/g.19604  ORF Transcript_10214/g.19604 Transcript_10214/m.19604 type:complete len:99 (-) Transcript_10214:11-307(-)
MQDVVKDLDMDILDLVAVSNQLRILSSVLGLTARAAAVNLGANVESRLEQYAFPSARWAILHQGDETRSEISGPCGGDGGIWIGYQEVIHSVLKTKVM